MTSTTSNPTITNTAYTQVTTGSAQVTVHGGGRTPFETIVGQSLPAPSTPGCVVGEAEGYVWARSNLVSGVDNVYVKALDLNRLTVRVEYL